MIKKCFKCKGDHLIKDCPLLKDGTVVFALKLFMHSLSPALLQEASESQTESEVEKLKGMLSAQRQK